MTDIEVGRFGLRTFRVDRDGHLLPIAGGDRFDWRDGVCFAECKAGGLHRPPADGCSCGIYSFSSLEALQSQYSNSAYLVAVVAPEGQARIGQNGTVSERARVIALWTADERLTAKVRQATSEKIKPYVDLETMVNDHGLRFTAEIAEPVDLRPAHAVRSFADEVAQSVAGLGWGRIAEAMCAAVVLHLLVTGFAAAGDRPASADVAAVIALVEALDRVLLVAGHNVTVWAVLILMLSVVASLVRLLFRPRSRTPADGRLMRHVTSTLLRRLILPLIFVGTYQMINGQFPGWDLIGLIVAFVVLESWANGGTVYHLTRAAASSLARRREPGPLYPEPTLGELIDAAKNRLRRREQ